MCPRPGLGEPLDCNGRWSGFFVLCLTTALSFIRDLIKIKFLRLHGDGVGIQGCGEVSPGSEGCVSAEGSGAPSPCFIL